MLKKIVKIISVIFCSLFAIAGGVFIISSSNPSDLQARAIELRSYCRFRGYNTDYGILVDYGRHSFQQRLYVVDLNTGDIVMRSLCGHGRGGNSNMFKGEFSNVSGSHCSSLGHYKIGKERKGECITIRLMPLNLMVWIRPTPMPAPERFFFIRLLGQGVWVV